MVDSKPQVSEKLLTIECQGQSMMGIAHVPDASTDIGVVLVVGGPQYRVGSHRQFVLLARALALQGIPVLRFDYRGMGDSSGSMRDFEAIHQDILAAINVMSTIVPKAKRWVLWGLCDAATASAFYAPQDARVIGLILLNPWVRTEEGASQAYLKHYYLQRFLSLAFWKKMVSGGFQWRESWSSFRQKLNAVYRSKQSSGTVQNEHENYTSGPLPERMHAAMQAFKGESLVILSGQDLTAKEFEQAVSQSVEWKGLLASNRVERVVIKDADHTFSRRVWRDEVARITGDWLLRLT